MIVTEFVGQIWENGEFGVAISPQPSPECPFDLKSGDLSDEDREWNANLVKVHGALAVLEWKGVDPLGFSPLPKNHKRKIRGQAGISSHGKKLIRNACWRLESENSKDCLTFATFTVPAISRDESLFLSEQWGEIQRHFIQKLSRALKAEGLLGEIVGATEIQEERSHRDGVIALHLHLVFVGRHRKSTWSISPSEYNELWKSVLQGYLFNSPQDYDWRAVHNVQRVKKSVESYLGKYVSKGAKSVQAIVDEFGEGCLPRHWYTCTNSLRSRVFKAREKISGANAESLVQCCINSFDEFFIYRLPIVVKMPSGREITIGWFGRLRAEFRDMFTSGVRS